MVVEFSFVLKIGLSLYKTLYISTNYCINSIIFKTVFANTCPIQGKKKHSGFPSGFFLLFYLFGIFLGSRLGLGRRHTTLLHI